jgi:N-methylhydantoinase A
VSEKIPSESQRSLWIADLRYRGQNFELSIPISAQVELGAPELAESFHAAHDRAYGFAQPAEMIELVSLRVTVTGLLQRPDLPLPADRQLAHPVAIRGTLFAPDVWLDSSVYDRKDLAPGQIISGPAIIEQMDATTPIWPGDVARIDRSGNLIITLTPVL